MPKRERMWELRQAADPRTLQLYIYGDVEGDGYDWWTDEVIRSETSANAFREELAAHPNVQEIEVFINSYGGSVFEGTAIYNQLRRHPAHKTVHIDGFACSIASVIAMAGDTVIMPGNTLMMIHNMRMGVYGTAAELRKAADNLDTINAAGRMAYLAKAGDKLSEEKLVEMMDAETWLTAAQCVALGLADETAEHDADMTSAREQLAKATQNIKDQVRTMKSIAAQLRALREESTTPVTSVPVLPSPLAGKVAPQGPEGVEPDQTPTLMKFLANIAM